MINYDNFQKPRLRVTILTPSLLPGGAERWVAALCRHFVTCRVTCVAVRTADQSIRGELPHGIPVETAIHVDSPVEDVVHKAIAYGSDVLLTWGCLDLASLRGSLDIPIIHVSHTSVTQYQHDEGQIHANFLAAVSESAGEVFPQTLRLRTKVEVIHNGADIERTRPRFGGAFQRRAWGVPETSKLVLYLGRLSEEKNPAALLRCAPKLPDNYRIAMVGWGALAEELMESTGPNNCRQVPGSPSNILFPKPTTAHVGDILEACDCLVIPSNTEAFPLTLVEAWMAARPVVTTDYPTIKEIATKYFDGKFPGLVVPLQPSPEVLANAIQSACTMPRDDSRIRDSYFVAYNQLTASAMAARWEDYLHQCVQTWRESGVYGQVQYARPFAHPQVISADQMIPTPSLSGETPPAPPQMQSFPERELGEPHRAREQPMAYDPELLGNIPVAEGPPDWYGDADKPHEAFKEQLDASGG